MSPYRDGAPMRLTKLEGTDTWVVVADVIAVTVRGENQVAVLFRNGEELVWTTKRPVDLAAKFVESINKAGSAPSTPAAEFWQRTEAT